MSCHETLNMSCHKTLNIENVIDVVDVVDVSDEMSPKPHGFGLIVHQHGSFSDTFTHCFLCVLAMIELLNHRKLHKCTLSKFGCIAYKYCSGALWMHAMLSCDPSGRSKHAQHLLNESAAHRVKRCNACQCMWKRAHFIWRAQLDKQHRAGDSTLVICMQHGTSRHAVLTLLPLVAGK